MATTGHETTNATESVDDTGDNGHHIQHGKGWYFVFVEKPQHGGNGKQQGPKKNKPIAAEKLPEML